MIATVDGPAIIAGYEYRLQIAVGGIPAPFADDPVLRAHVRRTTGSAQILANLVTDGGITIVNDTTIDLVITAAQSAGWKPGSVFLDVVRDEAGSPDIYLGFRLEIPVMLPVTRGLA
jgi:hypothetical protein